MAKQKADPELRKLITERKEFVSKVFKRLHIESDDNTAWAIADLEHQTKHITELKTDIPKFSKAHRIPQWKFYAFFAYCYGEFDGSQVGLQKHLAEHHPDPPEAGTRKNRFTQISHAGEPILPS
jgi:hypothetical protein